MIIVVWDGLIVVVGVRLLSLMWIFGVYLYLFTLLCRYDFRACLVGLSVLLECCCNFACFCGLYWFVLHVLMFVLYTKLCLFLVVLALDVWCWLIRYLVGFDDVYFADVMF